MKTITTNKVIAYCKRELDVQKKTYPNLVANKKMTNSQLIEYAKIIKDLSEIAIEAERRGVKWSEIIELIKSKDDLQKSLFK